MEKVIEFVTLEHFKKNVKPLREDFPIYVRLSVGSDGKYYLQGTEVVLGKVTSIVSPQLNWVLDDESKMAQKLFSSSYNLTKVYRGTTNWFELGVDPFSPTFKWNESGKYICVRGYIPAGNKCIYNRCMTKVISSSFVAVEFLDC